MNKGLGLVVKFSVTIAMAVGATVKKIKRTWALFKRIISIIILNYYYNLFFLIH